MEDRMLGGGEMLRQVSTRVMLGLLVLMGMAPAPAPCAAPRPDGTPFDFRAAGGWYGQRAEWVSVDGDRIAFGQGHHVHLATGLTAPVLVRSIEAGAHVQDAVLVEDTLYVTDGSRIGLLDLGDAAPSLRPMHVSPAPRNAVSITRMTDYLVVAENGVGLHVLALPPPQGMPIMEMGHQDHAEHSSTGDRQNLKPVAFYAMDATFGSATAAGDIVYALTGPGRVTAVDFGKPDSPGSRTLAVDPSARALAASGRTLYVLSEERLAVVDVSRSDGPTISIHRNVRGSALEVTGRAINVAAGDGGLRTFVDKAPTAAIIGVTVGNNFFSPQHVTVSPGDTVRWTKGGGFHNVEGCSPGAGNGRCGSLTSSEVFRSGPATFDPFVYTHTFTVEGTHGYVCVIHASGGLGMVGSVTVEVVPSCGDGVLNQPAEECDDGNGTSGDGCEADCTFTRSGELPATLTLDKAAGDAITLAWGDSCAPSDVAAGLYEGALPDFLTYSQLSCDNAGGQATFVPIVDSAFYLVVPHNQNSEGSYGQDSDGNPRPPGAVTCRVQRLGTCP